MLCGRTLVSVLAQRRNEAGKGERVHCYLFWRQSLSAPGSNVHEKLNTATLAAARLPSGEYHSLRTTNSGSEDKKCAVCTTRQVTCLSRCLHLPTDSNEDVRRSIFCGLFETIACPQVIVCSDADLRPQTEKARCDVITQRNENPFGRNATQLRTRQWKSVQRSAASLALRQDASCPFDNSRPSAPHSLPRN